MPAIIVRDRETGQEVAVDDQVYAANPEAYEVAEGQSVNVDVTRGLGASGAARSVSAEELARTRDVASALSPEEQAARTREAANEQQYGGLGSTARQGFRGLLSGGSLGLSELLLRSGETSLEREDLLTEREVAGPAFGAGELIGDVGSAILSGGTGVAGRVASRGTLSGLLAREGERLTAGLAPRLGGIGSAAAGNAFEGAISGAVQEATEQALADRPFSGEALLASGGRGLLLGGAIGGGFAGAGRGLGAVLRATDGATSPARLADALDALPAKEQAKLTASATGAAPAAPETTGKAKSLRSVVPLDERSREAVIGKATDLNTAIEEQAAYAKTIRRAVEAATPTLSPRAAAELKIAEQAYRDSVALARRQFRDLTRAVNQGKVPNLAEDVDGSMSALRRLEQTRADLDARLSGGAVAPGMPEVPAGPGPREFPGLGGAFSKATPKPPPTLPRAELPEGFDRGPNIADEAPIYRGVPQHAEVNADALYVIKASDIADRVRDPQKGAGKQPQRVDSIVEGWDQGRTFTPLEAVLRKDGTIELNQGRHRFEAALRQDREVPIRIDRSIEDMTEDEIAARLGRGGSDALSAKLGKIEQKTGKAAPDWVKKGLARKAAAGESIEDAIGGATRGVSPRSTDRVVRFSGGVPAGAYDPKTGEVLDPAHQIRTSEKAADAPATAPKAEPSSTPSAEPEAVRAEMPAPRRGVGDVKKATDTIMPGLPPPSRAGRLGGAAADAAAMVETAQSLGLPIPSVTEAVGLGPLGKLFAAYRVGRMALARAGVIRGNALAKTAGRVTQVRDQVSTIVRGITEKGAKLLASSTAARAATRASIRATKDELREVQELARNPEAIHARIEADSPHAPPEVLLAAAQAAERKVQYLAKAAPQPAWAGSPFATVVEPTEMELRRWNEIQDALDAPLSVLRDLARGVWSPETFEAVASVYPGLTEAFASQVMDRAEEIVEKAPRETRIALGTALGIPLDGTQLDWYEAGVVATEASQKAAQPQQRQSSYLPSQSQSAELALTPAQRRAQR